mmetsp:Transcript_22203/g.50127  ORF Transcript_22203/g.50127 Transcript_22203/m.50127 type:complete len:303 (-) Transcript_22203:324-1232(-)
MQTTLLVFVGALRSYAAASQVAHFLSSHNLSRELEVSFGGGGWSTEHQRWEHLCNALLHRPTSLVQHGLHLEFGTRNAAMLNILARGFNRTIWHGFDSFQGLPQGSGAKEWSSGKYSTGGVLPKVESNVKLHAGWFNETLPRFFHSHPAPVAFMHMDADIYSSTICVLDAIFEQCRHRAGTVIAFDELFGTASQLQQEYRALVEASTRWGVQYQYITYGLTRKSLYARAAIQVTDVGKRCYDALIGDHVEELLLHHKGPIARAVGRTSPDKCVRLGLNASKKPWILKVPTRNVIHAGEIEQA